MTTPTISAVSGTQSNGNLLTITTTNAMNESDTNWVTGLKKTDSGYLHDGSAPMLDGWFDADVNSYHTDYVLIGSGSIGGTISGATSSATSGASSAWTFGTINTGTLHLRIYVLTDGGSEWPNLFNKMLWNGISNNSSFLNWEHSGSAPTRLMRGYDGATLAQTDSAISAWQHQRWYCIEWELPAAASAGTSRIRVNNVLIDEVATGGDQGTLSWLEIFTNLAGTTSGFTMTFRHSGFTGSSSRINPASIIELADGSNYATANKTYLFPDRLTETEVKAWYDDTGLTGGSRYLFVTNNLGETSSGFLLSGGATSVKMGGWRSH